MINTSGCSEIIPIISPQDSQGKEIFVGDYVVYNLSGSLEKGKIFSIKKFKFKESRPGSGMEKWYYLDCEIQISSCLDGKISKIKNPNSIYKISEVSNPDAYRY